MAQGLSKGSLEAMQVAGMHMRVEGTLTQPELQSCSCMRGQLRGIIHPPAGCSPFCKKTEILGSLARALRPIITGHKRTT